MSSHDSPLICRAAEDPIAYISTKLKCLGELSGTISAQQFLDHVRQLAEKLPEQRHAINLCGNRYLFMVALCAVIVRKQTNLLPPNTHLTTQEMLNRRYENSYILHDGIEASDNIEQFDLAKTTLTSSNTDFNIPRIAREHLAVISFTSGSTGDSKPNHKTWHTLVASTEINRRYMLPRSDQTFYQLATVPGQHMWGLETSVLLALHANVCSTDSQAFYPYDICKQLAALPTPRMLVSTPVHLRTLAKADITYPALSGVLCATAPLSQTLANDIEVKFSTTLREIYGCSEIGSMALRITADEMRWQRFEGINFTRKDQHLVTVCADHIAQAVTLNDHIELLDETHFMLSGREADMINIAGKRGSLYEINQLLQSFPGLADGIVFLPPQEQTVPRLAAMVVLANGSTREQLIDYLRQHLDKAFIPRTILKTPSLPREKNGKLPRNRLLEHYTLLKNTKNP
ncbi:MAG: AMP-ligase [Gammaproteobacteria bacterium]|nr:MAG: AMP-ligase [Gammaproteobacteria bacterium]